MSVFGLAKKAVQQAASCLGYAIVKKQVYDDFVPWAHAERHPEIAIREDDEMSIVPKATLDMLIRESRLLREQAGQLAQAQRTKEIAWAGQTFDTESPSSGPHPNNDNPDSLYAPVFNFCGLTTDPRVVHNHDFLNDSRFVRAYRRGIKAAAGLDDQYYWRVHVALWCASHALTLPGDFVECGVWRGVLASAIMDYHDWNSLGRRFVLFDTFKGFDTKQVSDEEILKGNIAHFRDYYQNDVYDDVVQNFSEFNNVEIVRGPVPDTLSSKTIERVCYLSIDMNNAAPEIAAGNYFWDRLVPGAPILLDDYGFVTYEVQKRAWNKFADEHGVSILALPTGQGLLLKPPL